MGGAIGDILPFAVGVALSPVPIIAVILMLFSKRAKTNSLLFLTGWVVGLSVVCVLVTLFSSSLDFEPSSGASTGAAILRLVLGLLLFGAAFRNWKKRPKPGEEAELPKWLSTVEEFKAGQSLGIGALLSSVNPKNLALTLAAALAVSQTELPTGQTAVVLAIYVVLASVSIAAPVFVNLVAGKKAEGTLEGMRVWLTHNNATVMFVLFLVFGAAVIGQGIAGLT